MSNLSSIPNLITYTEKAPFGPLRLVRHDYGIEGPANYNVIFQGINAGQLVRNAWLGSRWLKETIGEDTITAFLHDDEWGRQFDKRIAHDLIHAEHSNHRHIGWLALQRADEAHSWRPDKVLGVSLAAQDVPGNMLVRAYNRSYHPERIRARISDVSVLTSEHGKGIGTALLDASLACFKPEQVPVTYVPGNNHSLIEKLGELGFVETGAQSLAGLLPGDSQLEATCLEADSVEAVRMRMAARYAWIADADVYINSLDI